MSKRIVTQIESKDAFRRDADEDTEGTNLDLIRIYGASEYTVYYAVIIADDNLFEGL